MGDRPLEQRSGAANRLGPTGIRLRDIGTSLVPVSCADATTPALILCNVTAHRPSRAISHATLLVYILSLTIHRSHTRAPHQHSPSFGQQGVVENRQLTIEFCCREQLRHHQRKPNEGREDLFRSR